MKKNILLSIVATILLLSSSTTFGQILDLRTPSTFETYIRAKAVTNNGVMVKDVKTLHFIEPIKLSCFQQSNYTFSLFVESKTLIIEFFKLKLIV
jgi:hypothetical protein